MAVTAWHVLFLQEDTFPSVALLSAAIALLFTPHAPMKSSAANNDPGIFAFIIVSIAASSKKTTTSRSKNIQ